MIQFTEDCILGVEEIDQEHEHMFELLDKAMYMLNNKYTGDQYSSIKALLEELEEYAELHFEHEEAYMEQLRDPELILQRSQHLYFKGKVVEFLVQNIDEEEQQREVLTDIIYFLGKWLYHHIIGSDMLIGKLPPLEEWMIRENPCEFTEEYETGIYLIDREHKMLFELVERANRIVQSWSAGEKIDDILHILSELKSYTEIHFKDEEEYMEGIGYEGLAAQKRAHNAFIARLEELDLEKIETDPQQYLASLMEFLLGWLINHILQVDKKIPLQ